MTDYHSHTEADAYLDAWRDALPDPRPTLADVAEESSDYYVEVDGNGDVTLWCEDGNPHGPLPVLREVDLPPRARYLWPTLLTALGVEEYSPARVAADDPWLTHLAKETP